MDAVALVVEEHFSELHCCFCGLQNTCFSITTTSDVARMHMTSDTFNHLRELAALEGLAVLEGPACDMYRLRHPKRAQNRN